MKGKIDKLNFTKIKNFSFTKYNVDRMKRQAIIGRKYLLSTYLMKG